MELTENPAAAATQANRTDVELALSAVQDGGAREALRLIDSYYAAEIQQLKVKIEAGGAGGSSAGKDGSWEGDVGSGGPFDAAVKRVFGWMEETPQNWHQLLCFAVTRREQSDEDALATDAALRKHAPTIMLTSVIIVAMQCATAAGVMGACHFFATQYVYHIKDNVRDAQLSGRGGGGGGANSSPSSMMNGLAGDICTYTSMMAGRDVTNGIGGVWPRLFYGEYPREHANGPIVHADPLNSQP